jgi:hypothetical protein
MAADADINDPRISNSAAVLPTKAINSTPYIDFRTLSAAMKSLGEIVCGNGVAPNPLSAAVEILLPFDPAFVYIFNETQLADFTHFPSLAAGEATKRITAGTLTLETTEGVTLGAKGERKFTVFSDVLAADDVFHFIAIGTRGPDVVSG